MGARLGSGLVVGAARKSGGDSGAIVATARFNKWIYALCWRLTGDADLTMEKGQWVGSSMEGLLGSGGARITLETVNGNIDIKKR